jgi:hypothetical protein
MKRVLALQIVYQFISNIGLSTFSAKRPLLGGPWHCVGQEFRKKPLAISDFQFHSSICWMVDAIMCGYFTKFKRIDAL